MPNMIRSTILALTFAMSACNGLVVDGDNDGAGGGTANDPDTMIVRGPEGVTSSTVAIFHFTCDHGQCTYECQFANTVSDVELWLGCESPIPFRDLADGEYVFRVRATDVTGETDESPAIREWSVAATAATDITEFALPATLPNTGMMHCLLSSGCPPVESLGGRAGEDAQYRHGLQRWQLIDNEIAYDQIRGQYWIRGAGEVYDFRDAVNSCNYLDYYIGDLDWRLPTLEELLFALSFGEEDEGVHQFASNPSLPIATATQGECSFGPCFAAVSYAKAEDYFSRYVSVQGMGIDWYEEVVGLVRVACVSGSYTPSEDGLVYNSETLLDKSTGLEWERFFKADPGSVVSLETQWNDALHYCGLRQAGGYDDWRLPNVYEMMSLALRYLENKSDFRSYFGVDLFGYVAGAGGDRRYVTSTGAPRDGEKLPYMVWMPSTIPDLATFGPTVKIAEGKLRHICVRGGR